MAGSGQLGKLKKVIQFYEQDCEIIRRRLWEQNAIVAQKQNGLNNLARQLALAQQNSDRWEPTAFNHQLVNHLMNSIETKLIHSRQELAEAVIELGQRRNELQKKMSKIESLEKLLARKSEALSQRARQREQRLSDERYLKTHFTGSNK